MARLSSTATKLVLQTFLDAPGDETYGFELARAAGVASGTLYPILQRLEKERLVQAYWAEANSAGQRRRRKYYSLTGEGRRAANRATAEQRAGLRLLAPGWRSP